MGTRDCSAVEKLVDALINLMKEKDYMLITVSDICRKAGVSRMAFYRGFASKDDLLDKFICGIANGVHHKLTSKKEFNAKAYFSELFSEIGKYRDLIISSDKSNICALILKSFDRQMSITFKDENDKTNGYRSHFIAGAIFNVFFNWIINGQQESPDEMAEICCGIVNI